MSLSPTPSLQVGLGARTGCAAGAIFGACNTVNQNTFYHSVFRGIAMAPSECGQPPQFRALGVLKEDTEEDSEAEAETETEAQE